ncbi:MAG: PHP domain-containing protein [Negativicutes bacterium]|nr:PHP domain-containing protein [Negativicutes bacterium]
MFVDLHIHSTFSDGFFTPKEIIDTAIAKKIAALSITDHDSVNGYLAALAYLKTLKNGPKMFSGIELSTQDEDKNIHVLGYHFDAAYEPLLSRTFELRHAREIRLEKIIEKVRGLGFDIEVEVTDTSHRAFGRPHVAKALVEKGFFKSIQQAFDVLLKRGRPAYVPQPKLTPQEAVDLIHQAGGIACLAHPSELKNFNLVETLIKETNFDGIEVWHPSANEVESSSYFKLAQKYKLLICGGSDFHGDTGRFPHSLGEFLVLYENVKSVIEYK